MSQLGDGVASGTHDDVTQSRINTIYVAWLEVNDWQKYNRQSTPMFTFVYQLRHSMPGMARESQ